MKWEICFFGSFVGFFGRLRFCARDCDWECCCCILICYDEMNECLQSGIKIVFAGTLISNVFGMNWNVHSCKSGANLIFNLFRETLRR